MVSENGVGGIQNSELMYSATIVSKSLGIFSPFLVFNYCCFLSWVLFQARLNEIITSGATIHSNGMSKKPWMVDGAGLPSNASELLPKLVNFSLLEWLRYGNISHYLKNHWAFPLFLAELYVKKAYFSLFGHPCIVFLPIIQLVTNFYHIV